MPNAKPRWNNPKTHCCPHFSHISNYPSIKSSLNIQKYQIFYNKNSEKEKKKRTNLTKSNNSNNAIKERKTHIHSNQFSRKSTRLFLFFKHLSISPFPLLYKTKNKGLYLYPIIIPSARKKKERVKEAKTLLGL